MSYKPQRFELTSSSPVVSPSTVQSDLFDLQHSGFLETRLSGPFRLDKAAAALAGGLAKVEWMLCLGLAGSLMTKELSFWSNSRLLLAPVWLDSPRL